MNADKSSLGKKVVKGGMWVFALRGTERLFSFVRLIIIARILAPADFGLMGIALLTMATLETFTRTGFQSALIQKKEEIRPYLDAAWTVAILRGIALFLILYFVAPYAAIFFKSPKALSIIRVIGFSFLLQAFTNIGVIYFRKELEFNKQFIYQFTGTIADFVVAVSAAVILRNVWALVYGLLAGNTARLIISYFIHPYKPHLSSDLGKVKELWGFGKWLLGSSILIFLITQGDDIFVGKMLGVAALGFYQMAYRISNMPATEITHVISQVTFPAYSKLQDQLPKLCHAYLRTLQMTAFVSFPIAGGILFFAPDFTRIFLGEQWLPMVSAMQALVVYGLSRSLVSNTGSLFQAIGKPQISTRLQFLKLILLAAFIYPFTTQWGIGGTAVAVTLSGILVDIYVFRVTCKIMGFRIYNIVSSIISPASVTIVIIVFSWIAKNIIFAEVDNAVSFVFFVLAGCSLYIVLTFMIGKKFPNQSISGLYAELKSGVR